MSDVPQMSFTYPMPGLRLAEGRDRAQHSRAGFRVAGSTVVFRCPADGLCHGRACQVLGLLASAVVVRRLQRKMARRAVPGRRGALATALLPLPGLGAPLPAAAEAGAEATKGPRVPLEVPRILVGCWQLLERERSEEAAIATLTAYADAGFRTFDTADIYGPSEEILGDFRKGYMASHGGDGGLRFFTKYVPVLDSSLETAREVNKHSREMLGVSSLDVVQYCWYGPYLPGHVEAGKQLQQLQAEGSIQHLAGCNYDVAHLRELVEAGVPIEVNQVQFSLLDLRPENGMLEFCASHGIKLVCFGTVAGGWLSDKYLGAPAPPFLPGELQEGTASKKLYHDSLVAWAGPLGWDLFQDLLRALRAVADKHGTNIATVASAWVQRRLDDTCGGGVIVGVRDATHLADLVALRSTRLDDDDMKQLRQVLSRGWKPLGDVWDRERPPFAFVYPFLQLQYWPILASAYFGPLLLRDLRRLITR